jgi:hypothetical protein
MNTYSYLSLDPVENENNIRMVSVLAEIQTGHLQNIN